ncbi:MAG: hypothetical protein IJH39_05415 [Clostridia bacterium]|nr:hypothetical protein [Clostridia bacterium]
MNTILIDIFKVLTIALNSTNYENIIVNISCLALAIVSIISPITSFIGHVYYIIIFCYIQ